MSVTATTVLWRGSDLSYSEHAHGWYAYIDGGDYPHDEQEKLVDALMSAQEKEFDDRLPDYCSWHPHVSEIIGPVDTDFDIDIDETMREACEAVIDRFEEIEREAIGP